MLSGIRGGLFVLDLLRELNKRNGRQAFGLIVVLTVWALIVQPNLTAALQTHTQAVQLSAHMEGTAQAMAEAARWLALAGHRQHTQQEGTP